MNAERGDPGALFAGQPFALNVVDGVESMVASIGEATIRTTKGHVAFRRRRGFAYLWPPVFGDRGVEIVLSIALCRHDTSPRFKQVAHPAPRMWDAPHGGPRSCPAGRRGQGVAAGGIRERLVTALDGQPAGAAQRVRSSTAPPPAGASITIW